MSQIYIVKSTGSTMGDQVLRGVYGSLGAGGVFAPAPEFSSVSHLFQMIGSSGVPVQFDDLQVFEVADEQVPVFCAQLMSSLGDRWADMYGALTPTQPGLMTSMLKAEAATVQEGIRAYLQAAQMTTWLVPVKAHACVELPMDPEHIGRELSRGIPSTNILENEVHSANGFDDVRIDQEGRIVGLGYLHTVRAEAEPAENLAQPSEPVVLPAWASYQGGLDAQISGNIRVCARSMEEAVLAAGWKLALKNTGLSDLPVAISSIDSISERVAEPMGLRFTFMRGM